MNAGMVFPGSWIESASVQAQAIAFTHDRESTAEIPEAPTMSISLTPDSSITYAQCTTMINKERARLLAEYQNGQVELDSVGEFFLDLLVNSVLPYWYGTPWDFNGHTDIPNQGTVACGYLVSTTLRHMGVRVNRFRMAQQSALSEAKTLTMGESVFHFESAGIEDVIDSLKSGLDEGLYLVGLDQHVGYLLWKDDQLLFLHSNYTGPVEAMAEWAEESYAFLGNRHYYLAPISGNAKLMKSWLEGTEVAVVRD